MDMDIVEKYNCLHLIKDFSLYTSRVDSQRFVCSKHFPKLLIEIKENGYVPKNGLYLVDFLYSLNISGVCADIGTGETGIIAQYLKLMGAEEVYACDIDDAALNHAERCSDIAEQITWLHSDVLESVPGNVLFDIIASNPPQLPAERVDNPHDSGGKDGLEMIGKILDQGRKSLSPDGRIYLIVMDFLYDYNCSVSNRSLRSLATQYGYCSKIAMSYPVKVRDGGKIHQNKDYIELNFPGFKFESDNGNGFQHNLYIIEFAKQDSGN